MTWFGIIMFIYYALNISASLFYAGKGGVTITPGSLFFTVVLNIGFLAAILWVGTGSVF